MWSVYIFCMNVYIICSVREADPAYTEKVRKYVHSLRADGHDVHFPPDDVDQDDPTGARICAEHGEAMMEADEVHVFWDVNSKGSHFDLGMAYILGKPIVGVDIAEPDPPYKSYWKAVINP